MSKILKCPICKKKKPVRSDAKVCSDACRVKQWRKDMASKTDKEKLEKLFTEFGIGFTDGGVDGGDDCVWLDVDDEKIAGYGGFFAVFVFNDDESFDEVQIAE